MSDTPSFSNRTEFDLDPQERLRHRVLEATDADLTVEVSHVAGENSSGDWHIAVPESLTKVQLLRLPQLIEAALEKARRLRWLRD